MQECKILGFAKCTLKESGEDKLKISLAVPSISDKYTGFMPLNPVFLDYSKELQESLEEAILNYSDCHLETELNIVTQKIKIKNILFD